MSTQSLRGRWKVACINWSHPDAPHAISYLWDGEEMRTERYWPTWADAMAYVTTRQWPR
jgi:hypothetical protein